LPLTAQQFQILLSLTDGHLHGYGIIRDVAARTAGGLRIGTGTLYTALARLGDTGAGGGDRPAQPAERR
jgi:DNA-binding PadR family transcriptional regulator